MKKLLNLLLATPIIFLTSCSSGGGDTTPENDITGVWQLTEAEWNGDDLMPAYSEALYYYHSNGMYEVKGYLADGTYLNGVGTYSLNNDKTTESIKVTALTGETAGLYQSVTNTLNWVNENEVTTSSSSVPCIGGTGYSRSVKTTNSLGSAPSMPVIGVWRATEINLAGQDLMAPYSQVLYYFWANGEVGVEYYNSDGIDYWSVGTYTISSDQTTLTMSLEDITASVNIIKLEIDKAELYTPNLDGLGAYSLKVDREECIALSNWKK
jgi:hypothetical protein